MTSLDLRPAVPFSGPPGAEIMLLGEAPGSDEAAMGRPFVGEAGRELNSMLQVAGINRSACRIANVSKHQPPGNRLADWISKRPSGANVVPMRDSYVHPLLAQGYEELKREVEDLKPKLIIALGAIPLWAVSGKKGIKNWRGSQTRVGLGSGEAALISTYHPAYILRSYDDKPIAIQDLKRAKRWFEGGLKFPPSKPCLINPAPQAALDWIAAVPAGERLAFDLETSHGGISCAGLACGTLGAICIPLRNKAWTPFEEAEVIQGMKEVLGSHPVVGQNLLYDLQYTALWWGFTFPPVMDTMVAQSVLFPGMPKGLDFLASLYASHYVYWKNESKEIFDGWTPDVLWHYNCKDTLYTLEISYELEKLLAASGLTQQFDFQQAELFPCVLKTMLRGMRFSKAALHEASVEAEISLAKLSGELQKINPSGGKTPWYNSPVQQMALFYNDLGCEPILHRKTHKPTVEDEALKKISKKRPEFKPLCDRLFQYRQLNWLKNNPLSIEASPDGRIRTSFNIAGTETFRLSSSKDAFGASTNLQNISEGDDVLPNLRRMFLPDPGYILLDCDLMRADLQVVAWEAGDEDLKAALRAGEDMHNVNAAAIFGPGFSPLNRWTAKQGVHAANYGVKERTLATTLGTTVHEASRFLTRWFQAHPKISEWQLRVQRQLDATRIIKNVWGFRRVYTGRLDGVLPQALAWIGQSTVAITTNKAWSQLSQRIPWAQVLLQVHDSLVLQIPESRWAERKEIYQKMLMEIPFKDPLIIDVDLKASPVSWGDVKPAKWSD